MVGTLAKCQGQVKDQGLVELGLGRVNDGIIDAGSASGAPGQIVASQNACRFEERQRHLRCCVLQDLILFHAQAVYDQSVVVFRNGDNSLAGFDIDRFLTIVLLPVRRGVGNGAVNNAERLRGY